MTLGSLSLGTSGVSWSPNCFKGLGLRVKNPKPYTLNHEKNQRPVEEESDKGRRPLIVGDHSPQMALNPTKNLQTTIPKPYNP